MQVWIQIVKVCSTNVLKLLKFLGRVWTIAIWFVPTPMESIAGIFLSHYRIPARSYACSGIVNDRSRIFFVIVPKAYCVVNCHPIFLNSQTAESSSRFGNQMLIIIIPTFNRFEKFHVSLQLYDTSKTVIELLMLNVIFQVFVIACTHRDDVWPVIFLRFL